MKIAGIVSILTGIAIGLVVAFDRAPVPAAVESQVVNDAAESELPATKPVEDSVLAAAPEAVAPTHETPTTPTTWVCPVRGMVCTSSGDPVAGANVDVRLFEGRFADEAAEPLTSAQGVTDDDGMFVVTVQRQFGQTNVAEIFVKADGGVGYLRALLEHAYKDSRWSIPLVETTELSGRVVDTDGEPVVGAIVTPHECLPEAHSTHYIHASYAKTTTDSDGSFMLRNIWKGVWMLGVTAEGFQTALRNSISTSDTNLVISMEREAPDSVHAPDDASFAGRIEGAVVDADTGDGIAGVPVSVWGGKPNTRASATTGSAGQFELTHLPPGTYNLTCEWAPSIPPWTTDGAGHMSVTIPQDDQVASAGTFRVDRSIRVQGRVITEDGSPATGTFVWVMAEDLVGNENLESGFPAVWTDNSGRFTAYLRAPSSKLYLQASKPGWASPHIGPLRVDHRSLDDIIITVEPAASISGRWLNASGQATPAIARLEGRRYGSKKTLTFNASDGRHDMDEWLSIGEPFYIGDLVADTYTMTYWEGSFIEPTEPVYARSVTLETGQALRDLVLQPTPKSRCVVSGTVTFAGEPVAHATVQPLTGSDTISAANGDYSCTSIQPGGTTMAVRYTARGDGLEENRFLEVPAVLEINRIVHCDMAIAAGPGTIEGVIHVNDEPAANLHISTTVDWDDGSQEHVVAITNAQGLYRISGLPEGTRTVSIQSREGNRIAVRDSVGVQVLPHGVTRADFEYRSGALAVRADGVQNGETGHVLIVRGRIDIDTLTPQLIDQFRRDAVVDRDLTGDGAIAVNIPSGIYTIVVGAFDGGQPDIESMLATLRWKSIFVEVAENLETLVEVTMK